MTEANLERYRTALESLMAELSAGLRSRKDITIERCPDPLDEVQRAGDREVAILHLDRESKRLEDLKSALARIADGTYAICLHCEEEIKPKRMDAVPWAKYCIRCQEAADRQEFDAASSETFSEFEAAETARLFKVHPATVSRVLTGGANLGRASAWRR